MAPLAAFQSRGDVAFSCDKLTESWSSCMKNLRLSRVIHDTPLQALQMERDTGISERVTLRLSHAQAHDLHAHVLTHTQNCGSPGCSQLFT